MRLITSGETFLTTAMLCHLLPPSLIQHQYGVHTMGVRYAANYTMLGFLTMLCSIALIVLSFGFIGPEKPLGRSRLRCINFSYLCFFNCMILLWFLKHGDQFKLKVPITPKYFFHLNKSLHLFETNCTFLRLL